MHDSSLNILIVVCHNYLDETICRRGCVDGDQKSKFILKPVYLVSKLINTACKNYIMKTTQFFTRTVREWSPTGIELQNIKYNHLSKVVINSSGTSFDGSANVTVSVHSPRAQGCYKIKMHTCT